MRVYCSCSSHAVLRRVWRRFDVAVSVMIVTATATAVRCTLRDLRVRQRTS